MLNTLSSDGHLSQSSSGQADASTPDHAQLSLLVLSPCPAPAGQYQSQSWPLRTQDLASFPRHAWSSSKLQARQCPRSYTEAERRVLSRPEAWLRWAMLHSLDSGWGDVLEALDTAATGTSLRASSEEGAHLELRLETGEAQPCWRLETGKS